MEIKDLVKRALESRSVPKPQSGRVFLETLDRGAKFSLGNRTGEVIHITQGSVYVEMDGYYIYNGFGNREYIPKTKTHWAGLTQVKEKS